MSTAKTPAQAAAEEEYPYIEVQAMFPSDKLYNDRQMAKRAAFVRGAEWQASQQRGPSVEQVMEVVDDVLDEEWDKRRADEMRSRLSKLLKQ